jgi:hypothetical protein
MVIEFVGLGAGDVQVIVGEPVTGRTLASVASRPSPVGPSGMMSL